MSKDEAELEEILKPFHDDGCNQWNTKTDMRCTCPMASAQSAINAYCYKQVMELMPKKKNPDPLVDNSDAEFYQELGFDETVDLMRQAAAERFGQK